MLSTLLEIDPIETIIRAATNHKVEDTICKSCQDDKSEKILLENSWQSWQGMKWLLSQMTRNKPSG